MGVPKRKVSKSRKNQRRAHDHLTPPNWANCPNCGETMQRHRVCPSCGTYKGKQIVEIVDKTKSEEK